MPNVTHPALFEPIVIKGKTFKNRFIASPVGAGPIGYNELPSEQTLTQIRSRTHGVAMNILGETDVSGEGGRMPGAGDTDFTDLSGENLRGWRCLADTVHECGALAMIQLCHCGSSIVMETGYTVYGPVDTVNDRGITVHAMDEAVMAKTCEDFANAAAFMKAAGFDGVQFHFGHGWLCTQFLSPISNTRTDEYGGSLENRARLPIRIIKTVREKVGDDFLLDMRFSGEELREGGYTLDEAIEFCKMADEYVDMINISEGHYRDPVATRQFPGMFHERGCNAAVASLVRKAVKNARVSVVGAVNGLELANRIVTQGQADFLYLGRQLTSDPDFVVKAAEGRDHEILPCTLCFGCFPGPAEDAANDPDGDPPGANMGCPNAIPFGYDKVPDASESKRVLVVGGGIGGMRAAITAVGRGHSVLLIEKEAELGGILNCVKPDPHKEGFVRLLANLEATLRSTAAEIRLGTEISPELVAEFSPDVILAAVGASPITTGVPGIDGANIMEAVGAMDRVDEIGKKVVIIGGGLIGCELAIFLNELGHEVTLVVRSRLARTAPRLHRAGIRLWLAKGVEVLLRHRTIAAAENGVLVEDENGRRSYIHADTVIRALGLASNTEAVERIRACAGDAEVKLIGDCKKVGKITDANGDAIIAASHIATEFTPPERELPFALARAKEVTDMKK